MPLSEAPLNALQLTALPFLVVLVEAAGLRGFWDPSMVLPCPWVRFHAHLHCPCSRPQVVSCAWPYILLTGLRPLPGDSLRALSCRCAYCGPHCGRESARVLTSLIGSSPSGVCHLSRVCSSVWDPVGVAHPLHPSLLLGGVLVRLCGGPC